MFQLLQLFRNYTTGQDLDSMIAMSAFGKSLKAEYEAHGAEVPSYVTDTLRRLQNDISARTRDELERQLAVAKSQYSALMSRDERKADAAQRIADIERRLNPQAVAPVPEVQSAK